MCFKRFIRQVNKKQTNKTEKKYLRNKNEDLCLFLHQFFVTKLKHQATKWVYMALNALFNNYNNDLFTFAS
jgi:hypothetical protein